LIVVVSQITVGVREVSLLLGEPPEWEERDCFLSLSLSRLDIWLLADEHAVSGNKVSFKPQSFFFSSSFIFLRLSPFSVPSGNDWGTSRVYYFTLRIGDFWFSEKDKNISGFLPFLSTVCHFRISLSQE